jgi:beta-lactamase superfamily II metal-dependent hydrolase
VVVVAVVGWSSCGWWVRVRVWLVEASIGWRCQGVELILVVNGDGVVMELRKRGTAQIDTGDGRAVPAVIPDVTVLTTTAAHRRAWTERQRRRRRPEGGEEERRVLGLGILL